MGVKELRDTFNLATEPDASARKAFLDYKTQGGVQYQILTFEGSFADGVAFSIKSNLIRPNGDPNMMARETGLLLLSQRQRPE